MIKKIIFICFLFIGNFFALIAQEENLIAHIPFDQTTDEIINNITPINTGAQLRQDRFGKAGAYYFDGSSYLEYNKNNIFDLRPDYTIAFWIFPISTKQFQMILNRGWNAGDGNYSLELRQNSVSEGLKNLAYFEGSGRGGADFTFETFNWYHVAYVFTANNELNLYVNGELIATYNLPASALSGSSVNPLRIGADQSLFNFFEGLLDDIRFYDKALTRQEILKVAPQDPVGLISDSPGLLNTLQLDGTDDYVKLPEELVHDIEDDFTIETWVYWNAIPNSTEETLLEFTRSNTEEFELTTKYFRMAQIYNRPEYQFIEEVRFDNLLPRNEWAHLAVTLESDKDLLSVYINGKVVATNFTNGIRNVKPNEFNDPYVTSLNQPFVLRPQISGVDYDKFYLGRGIEKKYFQGQLEELRIWNTAKNEVDINENRFLPVKRNAEDLSVYINFDEGIPGGDNSGIEGLSEISQGQKGSFLNFTLKGNTSNYLRGEIGSNEIPLTFVSEESGIPGSRFKIYSENFNPYLDYLAYIDNQRLNVISRQSNHLIVQIPENVSSGLKKLRLQTINGYSNSVDYTVIDAEPEKSFTFSGTAIEGALEDARDVEFVDINNDGYDDIIACGSSGINAYINDQNAGFSEKRVLLATQGASQIAVADLVGNGQVDIAYTYRTDGTFDMGVIWLTSDGQKDYNYILQSSSISSALDRTIKLADIDNDGLIDIISSISGNSGYIEWFEALGNGNFAAGQIIASFPAIRSFDIGDINGDGYLDLIIAGGGQTALAKEYHNNGDGTFTFIKDISSLIRGSISVELIDYDLDGDLDVFFSNRGTPNSYWFKNNGSDISTAPYPLQNSDYAFESEVRDINGDGYPDIVTSLLDGRVVYHEHNGSDSPAYTRTTIADFYTGPRGLDLGDIDNDGDLDLVVSYRDDGVIEVFENLFTDNDFESFIVKDSIKAAIIQKNRHEVDITVKNETILTNIIPAFVVSERAIVELNGEEQISSQSEVNFTETVTYTITAEDGSAQNWKVTLNPLPAVPQITEVDDITQTSAEIEWTESSYADYYILEITEGDEFEDSFQSIEVEDLEYVATLSPGLNYSIRVKAVNAFGESAEYSEVEDIDMIPANPVIDNITEIQTDAAVANWNATDGATNYILDVASDSLFNSYVGGYNERRVGSTAESIIGLTPGITYWLKLRALNETGISGNSDTISFTTLPEPPSIQIDNIQQSSLVLNWNNTSLVEGYFLEIGTDTDTLLNEFSPEVTQIRLDTLKPATVYNFRIQSRNESGFSIFSERISALTKTATPEGLNTASILETEAEVVWKEVKGAEYYLLDVSEDSFSTLLAGYNEKRINSTQETLVQLNAGGSYYFRVKAVNQTGASPYSSIESFKTSPEAPTVRAATAISPQGFTANWDRVNGIGVSYILLLSIDSDFNQIVREDTLSSLSYTYAGLSDKKSYWYKVKALNETGSSGFSSSIAVMRPLSIANLDFPAEKSKTETEDIKITFEVSGGLNNYQIKLRYKGILEENWEEVITETADNAISLTISINEFDALGLNFEITISDGMNEVDESGFSIFWTDTESNIPVLELEKQWQMFSIPYQFEDNLIETIFDEMGPYEYKSEWRLVHYDGSQYLDAGAGINRIQLGLSYWFYSSEVEEIALDNISINLANNFRMELREGWNQIGNPYTVPIDWNSVRRANNLTGTVEQAILFDSNNDSYFTGSVIPVFGGAFVWSNSATSLEIDYQNSSSLRTEDESTWGSDLDSDSWEFDLFLNNKQLPLASVGMHPQAFPHKDEFDQMSLPRFLKYTEAYSYHSDYFFPYFRKDIRKSKNRESWLFEFSSNEAGKFNTLNWNSGEIANNHKTLWLIDEENGELINMSEVDSYEIWLTNGKQFSIHLTADPGEKPVPFKMSLSDPFPNPSTSVQKLKLSLPDNNGSYNYNLQILNVEGKVVAKLNKDQVKPGIQELEVDLGNLNLKAGAVYFYRLDVDGELMQRQFIKKFIYNP